MTETTTTAAAAPDEDVLWDVTKNPGSGITGLSPAEKIERNRNIARLYHANHARPVEEKKKEDVFFYWSRHGCLAEDCVTIVCQFDPKALGLTPLPKQVPTMAYLDYLISHELRRYWVSDKLRADDLKSPLASEGGFTIDALWEDGVVWTLLYRVHTADGQLIEFWETYVAQINDAGQVTHLDVWTDDLGLQDLLRAVWGPEVDVQKLTTMHYIGYLYDSVGQQHVSGGADA